MTGRPPVYVGRFAPSPTGPLHFGSLVAAVGSYLDAKKHHGQWLLRIEDLDPPRESTTAPAEIMSQLRAFGLFWDGDVLFQSSRLNAYEENLGDSGTKAWFSLAYAAESPLSAFIPAPAEAEASKQQKFPLQKDCELQAAKSNSKTWFSVPDTVMLSRTLATL